ncbi:hypothetical protein FRC02_007970 [Tulasnella sp. 418]|nr:hypothetical protein FRC02_007970 [Tulasnella sp. 418]
MAETNSSHGLGPIRRTPRSAPSNRGVTNTRRANSPKSGGAGKGRGAKPKTADDLDKELEDFMKDSTAEEKADSGAAVDEDVAMAA